MQTNPLNLSQPSSGDSNLIPRFLGPAGTNVPLPAPASVVAAGGLAMFSTHMVAPTRGPHHRRARSELGFRFQEDFDLTNGISNVTGSFEEIASEEDIFSTYMDIEKIGCKLEDSGSGSEDRVCRDQVAESTCAGEEPKTGNANSGGAVATSRTKHRHSISVDGSFMFSSAGAIGEGVLGEVMEAKKAMTAEQLAELTSIDPKRAKRILANRQSAARSKERKAHYILELERKVQILQTEATTLSAQLMLYQRDTTGLTTENSELKLRLLAMEQQAKLRDALNEALKQEVERLKFATGEIMSANEASNSALHPIACSSFFPTNLRQPSQAFHRSQLASADQTFLLSHSPFHSRSLSNTMPPDPLGRLQGLDIGNGSLRVKSEDSN